MVVDRTQSGREGPCRVVEELAKSETTVEVVADLASPDRTDVATELAARMTQFAPDGIVAVGGGRTLDGAKAARLRFEMPGLALDAPPAVLDPPTPARSVFVAVPTTSGSGSEATWNADLVTPEGDPVEIAHRSLVPDWALVDPAFAATLPAELVADGAFETAAQAIEAYLSAWSNPFSDALASDALTTVVRRLPHALKWSDDPDARAALHYAASAAGLAASNAARGVAHALARALVGPTGLSYGRLVGIALPHVLEYDRPSARDRIESLAVLTAGGDDGPRPALAARVRKLADAVRFPTDIRAAGGTADRVTADRAEVVARALRSPSVLANPRVPTAHDLEELLDRLVGPVPELPKPP